MATHKLFIIKSYFNYVYESFPADYVKQTMIKLFRFLLVLVWNFVVTSFRHLIKHMAGSRIDDDHEKIVDKSLVFDEQEEGFFRSSGNFDYLKFDDVGYEQEDGLFRSSSNLDYSKFDVLGDEQEDGLFRSSSNSDYSKFDVVDEDEKSESIFDVVEEEEKSEFTFGFRFQMKDNDLISYNEDVITDAKTGETGEVFKYQFASVKDIGGFVAEPESGSFTVHELFVEDCVKEDDFIIKEKGISRNLDRVEVKQEAIVKDEPKELNENSNLLLDEKVDDLIKTETFQRVDFSDTNSINSEEKYEDDFKESVKDSSSCSDEVQELPEKTQTKSETDQVDWLGEFFKKNDGFCYEDVFSQENELDSLDHHVESDVSGDGYISFSPQDSDSVDELELETLIQSVQEEIDDEYIEFEPNLDKQQQNSYSNGIFESDSCLENEMELEYEELKATVLEEKGNVEIKSKGFDSDEEYEDDVLLEHQDLISQMKMELKNARTGGLPTILEECETSRMKDDLKPLKLNEKLEHRDQMAEIQKFYKSYTEKMRKLDILNYQTSQAINFLRMKHPDQLNANENASLTAIKSVLMPSLWPCKLRRIYADPTLKSITELHKDLEIVYVGQACLSWEILHWQYKKAKELQLYDPQGYRSYNQVVIEFQQFHVLLRRFTEDELFQGPRVLNYTKERCTLRGLLQVPAIKDDNLKEKKARKEDEGDAVSVSTMAKTIKESMTVFWEFLHTDKDTTNLFLTVILQGSKANLQDPNDSDLFMEIKTIHQKKEKRLKDMLRTGNCIVKKFQKQQETILDQHMFVSQVELKLVSRVLSLPRLTRDQLVWCQSKLNNIKFIDRKIQVEDSLFLLFPC